MRADIFLLLASLIWGSAFVAQRVAALHFDAFFFNGTRFLVGGLLLLPFAYRGWGRITPRGWLGSILVGLLLFGGAAFQQSGLRYTTAGNAGFITGLYVVFIPLFLAVLWRLWPRPSVWLASLLAALGLFLLSTGGRFTLAAGDSLELAGAVLWAFHVILIGHLVKTVPVLPLSTIQFFVCAGLNLVTASLTGGAQAWPGLSTAWWTIAYTGVFSIGLGYTLQALGQRVAPAADAAILLSAEAVFAALFGWLLLGEQLSSLQLAGCALILSGMLLAQSTVFSQGAGQVSQRIEPVDREG